jgi:hypothetical protein
MNREITDVGSPAIQKCTRHQEVESSPMYSLINFNFI